MRAALTDAGRRWAMRLAGRRRFGVRGAGWLGCGVLAGLLAGCGGTAGVVSYGTISTLAGTGGVSGYAGDGGSATAAKLTSPSCVAVDASGNVFIGDAGANVVRVVTAGGTISTYAGTGTTGYSGDGGKAAKAQLNGPEGCAVDAAGNLYIADTGNNVVRLVTASTGVMTTVAGTGTAGFLGDGGKAAVAELNQPFGVAVDAAGNVYVGDTLNQRVRKVTAGGVISTIAGTGVYGFGGDGGAATAALLANPEGVAVSGTGDVYVAQQASNLVRKISGGNISTVAGQSKTYGFAGDGGKATSADLDGPAAVALDGAGNLFIADTGNMEVRRVMASTGVIQDVVGNGKRGFAGDSKAASNAELNRPRGLAFDAAGTMYIADFGNSVVRKVTAGK